MQLAQPPGVRSCWKDLGNFVPGEGGGWKYCRDCNGSAAFFAELNAMKSWMSRVDHDAFMVELRDVLDRAEVGRLIFGQGSASDVSKMDAVEVVLELRVRHRPRDSRRKGERQHIRIYFTEPDHQAGVLLMLLIASKRPGKPGLEEQDKQIREAQQRADAHFRRR